MNRNFESHGDIVGKNISLKSRDFSENYLMNAMGPDRYWNFAGKMANANVKNSLNFRNNVNAMAVDKYFNNPNIQDKLIDMDIKSYENTAKLVKNINNQSAASANIDKILSDNEHIMRGKDLANKAVTTGEGSKAIQNYKEILSKRTNPTTFKDKLDNFANSASYKTSQGLTSAKNAITEGFHGLSGKVQDLTGLSANAANIATGAGLGLAAAGFIGGGIALHKHLKKKKAAKKRMANMSQCDFDAWNPVDSLIKDKKTRQKIYAGYSIPVGAIAGGIVGNTVGHPVLGSVIGAGATTGWHTGIGAIENSLRGRRDRKVREYIQEQLESGVSPESVKLPTQVGTIVRTGQTVLSGLANPLSIPVNAAWSAGNAIYDTKRDQKLKEFYLKKASKDMSEQHLSSIVANSILKA